MDDLEKNIWGPLGVGGSLSIPYPGLEKYLNSTLPVEQVTLRFCLPGAIPCLPKFLNSIIIHEPKNGQTTGVF